MIVMGKIAPRLSATLKLGVSAGALLLTSCTTTTAPRVVPDRDTAYRMATPGQVVRGQNGQIISNGANQGEQASEPFEFQQRGAGAFTGGPALNGGQFAGDGDITLNLVNVDAADAVQQILGEILEMNYVIEAQLAGTVTIQTSRPVNESTAVRLLSSALTSQGATLIAEEGFYRVVSSGRAATTADGTGSVRIIPLRYVSADSMARMFSDMEAGGVSVDIDPDRNLLILRGDPRSLNGMVDMVNMFDVNWMNGMSFSATQVEYTSATQIVNELDTIFSTEAGGALSGVVRFVPLERLNVVLTVSPQADYLDDAEAWIERLDRSGGGASQRFYVIPIQNRAATEVANILRDTLSGSVSSSQGIADELGLRPGEEALFESSMEGVEALAAPAATDEAGLPAESQIRLFSDDSNNALVILATPEQFGLIENAVDRLDTTPNQVVLEATIAEVTLTDDLSYGLTWFFQSGEFNGGFSDVSNGAVAQQFPGFSVLFSGENGRAALSAVAGVTDVKILSAPSLMVLDNRTATLQVGDQVPIVTQSAVSVTNPDAPIVNSVSLRDTGIILNVTPRVNDGGLVILDIDQEVSDVIETQSSGIDSPTIQQRRISTSVAVNNNESIALGGLIRERISDNKTKVPLLGDIPLLGAAFSTTSQTTTRTELLILITPRVIADRDDAAIVTNDLRRRMKAIEDAYYIPAPIAPAIQAPQPADEPAVPVASNALDGTAFEEASIPLAHFVPLGSFERDS